MLTYASRIEFIDRDRGKAAIRVQSKMTFYVVGIDAGEESISVIGPGLDYELTEVEYKAVTFVCLASLEAQAVAAVLMLESRA